MKNGLMKKVAATIFLGVLAFAAALFAIGPSALSAVSTQEIVGGCKCKSYTGSYVSLNCAGSGTGCTAKHVDCCRLLNNGAYRCRSGVNQCSEVINCAPPSGSCTPVGEVIIGKKCVF